MSEHKSEEIQNTGEKDNQNVTNLVSSMGRLSILCPLPNISSQVKPSSAKDKQHYKKQNEVPQDNQEEEEQTEKDTKDFPPTENADAHHCIHKNEEDDYSVERVHSYNLSQEKIKPDDQKEHNSASKGNHVHVPAKEAVTVEKKTSKVSLGIEERNKKDEETEEKNDKDDKETKEKNKYAEDMGEEDHSDDENPDDNEFQKEVKRQPRLLQRGLEGTSKVSVGTEERNEKDEETEEKVDKETKEKNKLAEDVGEEDHSDDENPVDDDEFQKEVKRQPRLLQRGLEGGGFHQPQYYAQQTSFPRTHWQGTSEAPVATLHYGYADSGFQSPQHAQSADFPEMSNMQGGVADSRMFNRFQSPQYAQSADSPEMSYMQGGVDDSRMFNWNRSDGFSNGFSTSSYSIRSSLSDKSENSSDISSSDPSSPEQDAGYQAESGDQHNIEYVLEAIQSVINKQDILPVPAQILSGIKEYLYCETPEVDNKELTEEVSAEHCDIPSPNFQPIQHVNTSYSIPISQNRDNLAVRLHDSDWKRKLDQSLLLQYRRKLAMETNEKITGKDEDGDTPSMVVACGDVRSDGYLEKLVAVLERQKDIHMCCDTVVSRGVICSICGNTDENKFYSSLGIKNHEGHSILSGVIAMKCPSLVIECIIDYIKCRKSDIQRVFNNSSLQYYCHHQLQYPALSQFLDLLLGGGMY